MPIYRRGKQVMTFEEALGYTAKRYLDAKQKLAVLECQAGQHARTLEPLIRAFGNPVEHLSKIPRLNTDLLTSAYPTGQCLAALIEDIAATRQLLEQSRDELRRFGIDVAEQ
jgi:hypothetical protein